jgi:hypothetical protein
MTLNESDDHAAYAKRGGGRGVRRPDCQSGTGALFAFEIKAAGRAQEKICSAKFLLHSRRPSWRHEIEATLRPGICTGSILLAEKLREMLSASLGKRTIAADRATRLWRHAGPEFFAAFQGAVLQIEQAQDFLASLTIETLSHLPRKDASRSVAFRVESLRCVNHKNRR